MRVNNMNAVQSVEKQYHSEREMFIKEDGKDNGIVLTWETEQLDNQVY